MNEAPQLSIVIPAYNEEKRLPRTLERILAYFEHRPMSFEVIVVSDGSSDGTVEVVEGFCRRYREVRLISNPTNHGKGFSVRSGMLEARGEIALFTDADLSAPIEEADKLLEAMRERRLDGAIGSRAVDRSLIKVHQSQLRELAGIIFNRMVRLVTGVPFSDTQCGFKAFRRQSARILFQQQRITGFGFDPEILFLARRHGMHIAEVPVEWRHDPGTKVRVFSDSLQMFLALLTIRWDAWMGRYPLGELRSKVRADSKC